MPWALLGGHGCAAATPSIDALQSPARAPLSGPPTFAFDCGGETLAVVVIGNHATSLWPTRGVTLTRMASAGHEAASLLYSADAIKLQLHADGRASWLEPGRRTRRCTPRPVQALAAHARLGAGTRVVAVSVDGVPLEGCGREFD